MDIENYSKHIVKEKSCHEHAYFLPKHVFAIISGAMGGGKTNLLLNLLLKKVLSYNDVYIYCPTSDQDLYIYLKKKFEEAEKMTGREICHFFETDENLMGPGELDPNYSHVLIFDDVMGADQKKITDYFTKGRHNNANIFYLCQSIHQIKKHGIRQNANVFILFSQDINTLKYFHGTHIVGDMPFMEFYQFCDESWSSREHGFISINLWEKPYCGRYIKNFESIYIPQKYLKILKNT